MKNLISRFRIRRAHRRLSRSLDRLNEDRLEMASCLNNWIRITNLLPGDRVTLFFDGEHTDVVITDAKNAYLHLQERDLFNEMKDET